MFTDFNKNNLAGPKRNGTGGANSSNWRNNNNNTNYRNQSSWGSNNQGNWGSNNNNQGNWSNKQGNCSNNKENGDAAFKEYIDSSTTDWLLATPRRALVIWPCNICCALNFNRRQNMINNEDGTWTQPWQYCSDECMKFNKQQQFFLYSFFRGGDNINGPRDIKPVIFPLHPQL